MRKFFFFFLFSDKLNCSLKRGDYIEKKIVKRREEEKHQKKTVPNMRLTFIESEIRVNVCTLE
jgi:hypothetical protein